MAQFEASRGGNNGSNNNEGDGNPEGNRVDGNKETEGNNPSGCWYKTFMACKPNEFHGKEGPTGAIHWLEGMESVLDISNCGATDKVTFAAHSLKDEALSWWYMVQQTRGREVNSRMSWTKFKELIMGKYCPANELEKMEAELLQLEMKGVEHMQYTPRFNELSRLVPHLVTPETKRIGRYIWGLHPLIRPNTRAVKPQTYQAEVELSGSLTDELIRGRKATVGDNKGFKRKWEDNRPNVSSNEKFNKRPNMGRTTPSGNHDVTRGEYVGPKPYCGKCKLDHFGSCRDAACHKCGRTSHLARDCPIPRHNNNINRNNNNNTTLNNHNAKPPTCYGCGEVGHIQPNCRKAANAPKGAPKRQKGELSW
jgi:hypothetical protein